MKSNTEEIYRNADSEFSAADEEPISQKSHVPEPERFLKGIIFILTGLLVLANLLQIVPWSVWYHMLQFWPILIILLGLQIILSSHIILRILFILISLSIIFWVVGVCIYAVKPELLQMVPKQLLQLILWWEVIQT